MADVRTTIAPRPLDLTASSSDPLLAEEIPSLRKSAWRQFRQHKPALIGSAVFLTLIFATLLGPIVYRVPLDALDFTQSLHGPSLTHPFGTDDLGRDLMARVLLGGRVSMAVGVMAMLLSITMGT